MREPAEEFEYANCNITIDYDDSPESPREWDNLGTMVCWHSRYNLGDSHSFDDPQEFLNTVEPNDIVLPLYLYDHSGITMSTTGFSCPWDSGQVGYIHITAEKIREEYSVKRVSKKLKERVTNYLVGEVETYDQYLTGDVYGYTVEHKKSGEEDSCWGFYGIDFAIEEAKSIAEYFNREHTKSKQLKVKKLISNHVPLNVRQDIISAI